MIQEPEKADLDIDWGETVVLRCRDHRDWEESVIDLADALDEWEDHYERRHR
jgi:hypothetical protein